jgi:hypothetical protein
MLDIGAQAGGAAGRQSKLWCDSGTTLMSFLDVLLYTPSSRSQNVRSQFTISNCTLFLKVAQELQTALNTSL